MARPRRYGGAVPKEQHVLAILVAFASGALMTGALFWWWTRRAPAALSVSAVGTAGDTSADETDAHASANETAGDVIEHAPSTPAHGLPAAAASARLQQLAEALGPVGEASAHPRDLVSNPLFREAVGLFESDAVTLTTCTDYATGANWPLSAAAFAALAKRADGAQAVPVVIARLQAARPWPLYYALQYLAGLESPPPPGLVMLRCDDWWPEHPFLPAFLTDFFDSSAARRIPSSFVGTLPAATPAQRQTTEEVLKKLDHPVARSLLEELLAFRRAAIDREFLQTFGRFAADDPARLLLVEHDAIKDILTQGEAALYRQSPRSLLVVGEPRCGKSSVLSLIGERARAAGWVMFEAGGVELQAGQMYLGELEERLRRTRHGGRGGRHGGDDARSRVRALRGGP
jgi:ATP-dependent Clp protease ATP-binding subunit ClpC